MKTEDHRELRKKLRQNTDKVLVWFDGEHNNLTFEWSDDGHKVYGQIINVKDAWQIKHLRESNDSLFPRRIAREIWEDYHED
jgi:hypothetical protein